MKEEIKEILDYLGNDKNYNCDCNDGSYYLELPYREAHKLKNCITNLQEELEEQKRIEQASLDTINDLQEENKRLKEDIRKDEVYFKTFELAEECDQKQDIIDDYKQRIEKAIKYINEEQQKIDEMGDNYCYLDEYEINDLLNILKGDKDE